MSDFTSPFWSIYVALLTVLGIVGCLLLLWITSRKKVSSDANNTTGHVWDENLREMNNPLPMWWIWLFLITIVFSIAYLALYPGLGSFAGQKGWSQETQFDAEMASANVAMSGIYGRFAAMSTQELAKDPEARAIGERLFMNTCAQCHGSDAAGATSFPNLADNDWLGHNTPEAIENTIRNGRTGIMAPIGAAVGSPEDVRNTAEYALSLSGNATDQAAAAKGKEKFEMVCAACHGADGKGNKDLGAPNLTDNVWLHDVAYLDGVIGQINNGMVNVMPAQGRLLTSDQIKVLTAYVWGLSHQ